MARYKSVNGTARQRKGQMAVLCGTYGDVFSIHFRFSCFRYQYRYILVFTCCYIRESIGETLDDRYSFERRVC